MDDRASRRPTALVTGASSGIGAAYAERLASTGHDVVLVARRAERLNSLAERLGAENGIATRVLVADLSDGEGIRAVEQAIAGEPRLAVLVNNAGFSGYMPFAELPADEIDRLVEIHDIATARLTRAALPAMVANGRGAVVTMASLLAFSQSLPPEPLPYRVVYAACKAFVVAFTVLLRHELEGTGVQAMVCCPGVVESEFHGPHWKGPPRMSAEEVVTACVRGLEADESICVPGLDDPRLIEDLHAAQRALFRYARTVELAERYR